MRLQLWRLLDLARDAMSAAGLAGWAVASCAGAEFVRAAGKEFLEERLRIAERVRCLLGGLVQGPGLRFLQDLGGEEDGFAVVVLHGVASLEHGDQQRGARRLDSEQDADVAVGGRARTELHQALGRRL